VVARFIEAARKRDGDLGVLLWLAVVTGARRGELCGLRWSNVRLDKGYLVVSRSLARRGQQRKDKDTKTHRSRPLALDEVTAEILAEHRTRCEQRAATCSVAVDPDGYVFASSPDGKEPVLPETVTGRVLQLSKRLGVKVTLRNLRSRRRPTPARDAHQARAEACGPTRDAEGTSSAAAAGADAFSGCRETPISAHSTAQRVVSPLPHPATVSMPSGFHSLSHSCRRRCAVR
jgi:integrase